MSKEIETAKNVEMDFQVLNTDMQQLACLINENLDGEGFDSSLMQRITQKKDQFVIPYGTGEQIVREFEGIIILKNFQRTYWKKDYAENPNADPDCYSRDAKHGEFDPLKLGPDDVVPAGDCATCPLAQFGSGKNGGQACQKSYNMFVFLKESVIPFVLRVPVGSITNAKKYFASLLGSLLPYYGVVVRFETKTEKSSTGIEYDAIKLTTLRKLTEKEYNGIKELHQTYKNSAMNPTSK